MGQIATFAAAQLSGQDPTLLIVVALIALVGPAITAASTLVGVHLAGRSQRLNEQERHRRERDRWHLELRTDAYSKLIETADHFRTAARAVYLTPDDASEYHGYLSELDRLGQELDDAGSRILLLGSAVVEPILRQLAVQCLSELHNAAVAGSNPETLQQWNQANESFVDVYERFVDAARQDLGTDAKPAP